MLQSKVAQIADKRARSEPLPSGVAPYTNSKFFKLQKAGEKPKSHDLSHLFSRNSNKQYPSPLKQAAYAPLIEGTISLGTARPASEFYPWQNVSMQLKPGIVGSNAQMNCEAGEVPYDLAVAMNYGSSTGSPQLVRFLTEHTELVHNPPYDDWETFTTCGTTSAMEIAFKVFCNPGDTVLMEEYSYSGTITAARSQELKFLGIKMDDKGLSPEDLDTKLSNWDVSKGKKPHLLYTIPSGQNPTGATQPTERRQAIYRVAVKHDVYIIEDDAYYFLYLGTSASACPRTADDYLAQLPSSYLALDTTGRVMRMDTLSKILAPGLRCGWVTASSQAIQKFKTYTEVGVLSPSGPSQIMAYKLLDETWGHHNFFQWLMDLSLRYKQQRDVMLEACARHLPKKLCTWNIPNVGMFISVKINLSALLGEQQPTADSDAQVYLDIEDKIFNEICGYGVLVSKGSWFSVDATNVRTVSFRLTFAAVGEADMVEAVARFGNALKSQAL